MSQKIERDYQKARLELQRIVNMAGKNRSDVGKGMRGVSGANQAVIFAETGAVSCDLARPMIDYARDMNYLIISIRSERRQVNDTPIIKQVMTLTRKLGADIIEGLRKRGHAKATVYCGTAYGGAETNTRYTGTDWSIRLGPNWLRRVKKNGIAVAETTADPVFVMQATPKSSAFLKEEGITVFYAEVYRSSASGGAQAGYVFKSAGPTDGSDFVVFHEDFMRGVHLIRRRITRGVLDALLGQEEVQ